MFYLTTHSTHFIYGYMASDIWYRTILIVRKETRCCHIGYSLRLTRVLLYAPSHRQDSTYHGLCNTCIHTYTHCIHTHTHTHIHIHTYIHTCKHTYIHTHTHIYIYTSTHTYTHIHIHTYIHAYTHTYTYIHIYIYIHNTQCIHVLICTNLIKTVHTTPPPKKTP